MAFDKIYEVEPHWVQLQFPEQSVVQDVYGFSSTKGLITVEGVLYKPKDRPSKTVLIYMHPASTQTILPVPRVVASRGSHALAAGTRFTRNDTALSMEKCLRDLAAYVRHCKEVLGYEKVVLAGWSGGGSLMTFYQSQAENTTITHTPAGDPIDVKGFGLIPADGVVFHAAHRSRSYVLRTMIDPSVLDEDNPDIRDTELDLYDPRNPNQPPYTPEYIERFRAAQLDRMRRRTRWVKEMLHFLKDRGGVENERGFVTHRTMAEPAYLDMSYLPNDRQPRMSFVGEPETVNSAPAGLARFSTLRAWLSQWSIDDTHVDAVRNAAEISVPFMAIRNSGDDAVLGPQIEDVFAACTSKSKVFHVVEGANHYYAGQPDHLDIAIGMYRDYLQNNNLID